MTSKTIPVEDAAKAWMQDPEFRAGAEENILLRKNQAALGAFLPADRPKAIDYLGFASQSSGPPMMRWRANSPWPQP